MGRSAACICGSLEVHVVRHLVSSRELVAVQASEEKIGLAVSRFVVGVGVQKAATSSLASFLKLRGVAMHPKKELHAFYPAHRVVSREEYLANFPTLPTDGWFSEFTPEYCTHAHALINIKRMFPDVKVVFSYRNPITRLQSAYRHAAAENLIDRRLDLSTAIELGFRGHQNHWIDNLLRFGQYDTLLRTLDRVFKLQNVHVVRYEDLGTVAERDALNGLLEMLELPKLTADDPPIEALNSSSYHRDRSGFKANSDINESTLDRLMTHFAPVQSAMNRMGYRTEWF